MKTVYPDAGQRNLLTKKGIYCYDYMNNMTRFDETCLPHPIHFYNSLTGKDITKKQYEHAESVWATLNCTTMKDYHNHYLISDVLLLTDVFKNFRNMSMELYELDPIH